MPFFTSFPRPRTSSPQSKVGILAGEKRSVPSAGALSSKSISAIIPLYNHARYINSGLQSILTQTCPVDEIVLIDDGSSDNGFSVAQEMLAQIPNVILLRQENAGAHNTLNRAIQISSGEYLAVLNSDDMFAPNKIERCRRILAEAPSAGLISGDVGFMDNANKPYKKMSNWMKQANLFLDETGLPQLSLLFRMFVFTTSNMVFSRQLWEASNGFQPLRYCHDLDFLMFAYANTDVFLDRGHQHVLYRRHGCNTIKENAQKVDIEVAAVIAQTLKTNGAALFSEELNGNDLKAFQRMLARRKMSDLVLFFTAIAQKFKTRSELYEYATDPSRLNMLRNGLG